MMTRDCGLLSIPVCALPAGSQSETALLSHQGFHSHREACTLRALSVHYPISLIGSKVDVDAFDPVASSGIAIDLSLYSGYCAGCPQNNQAKGAPCGVLLSRSR